MLMAALHRATWNPQRSPQSPGAATASQPRSWRWTWRSSARIPAWFGFYWRNGKIWSKNSIFLSLSSLYILVYIYIYLWLCSASPFLLVPPCSTIFQPWILEENHFKGHPQAKEGERTPGLWADRMINHHKPWWMMNDKPLIFHL